MRADINIQDLIQDYKSGKSTTYICEKYKVSFWMFYNLLKKNNINKRLKFSGYNLENLNLQDILQQYNSGLSASKIAKQLGCSHTLVLDFLDKNNVLKTPKNQLIRKYKDIEENYFDNVDTEEKAYFLGLLYADGCVSKFYSCFEIGLQEEDRHILEKLSLSIMHKDILKFIDRSKCSRKNQWRLRVSNKHMCNSLKKIGCTPKKSLTLKFPEFLDGELIRHFIRGYFDGDGSISCNKNQNYGYKFKITSTFDFCKEADKQINKSLPMHFTYEINKNKVTTTISVGGNRQILRLMEWIYKDANIYLYRKYNKYKELVTRIEYVDTCLQNSEKHINQYL